MYHKTQQITLTSDNYDILLSRLKWLETAECRQCMDEEKRVAVRKEVTDRFRNMLQVQAVFVKLPPVRRQTISTIEKN